MGPPGGVIFDNISGVRWFRHVRGFAWLEQFLLVRGFAWLEQFLLVRGFAWLEQFLLVRALRAGETAS